MVILTHQAPRSLPLTAEKYHMLKDAMSGFVCIQTVCYLLRDALPGVWTWLYMFQASL